MNVCVVCKESEREEVSKAIVDFFEMPSIEFISSKLVFEKIQFCNVVVSKNSLTDFRGMVFQEKKENLYLCFSDKIFQAIADEKLLVKRNQFIADEKWYLAKKINSVLLAIDFLFQREECKGMPDYLQIETTSYCNAKCIMCSHYFSNNKGACHLSQSTLCNMEDAIQLSSTISLNGMGEPFVSPEVSNQIDYYKQFGNRIVTNTNLSVINDRIIAQINTCFDWLEISVDGADQQMYENIRKNLSFVSLKENLMRLKQECPNVRKHIATVIMRQNVIEMPQMVELAYEAGASIITFMTLNANIIIQNYMDEMSNYPKVLQYYSKMALKRGEELGIPVIVPNAAFIDESIQLKDIEDELAIMDSFEKFKPVESEKKMYETAKIVEDYLSENDETQYDTVSSSVKCRGICDWILKQSYIDLQGNVAMCCRNQSFHMGNVNDEGCFSVVWNGDFYKKMRRIFYSGYIPEACLKCGLIESGNLHFLDMDRDTEFYKDPAYKKRQKLVLKGLLQKDSE